MAAALAAEDMEVEFVPFGQTFHGRQGFSDFIGGFKRAFPDLIVTVTNQVADENQVVNECTWRGTNTGPLITPMGEIPPTNRKVEGGRFIEVYEIKNGKLAVDRNYQDAASWLRQLGLVP
jgi:steroid delta-isomerase-like uncharacterized protein